MSKLIVDVPLVNCFIRKEYLFDLLSNHNEYEDCVWHAATSIDGRALMPQVITNKGVLRQHLPISALTTKVHPEHIPLEVAQLWNCFSYNVVCHEYDFLKGLRFEVILKDGSEVEGNYVFTFDWYNSAISESPGEGGHKCGHVINLDCGCFVIQPDNRVMVREASFVTRPMSWNEAKSQGYKTNTYNWKVEQSSTKWVTEDTDQYFYSYVNPSTDNLNDSPEQ